MDHPKTVDDDYLQPKGQGSDSATSPSETSPILSELDVSNLSGITGDVLTAVPPLLPSPLVSLPSNYRQGAPFSEEECEGVDGPRLPVSFHAH